MKEKIEEKLSNLHSELLGSKEISLITYTGDMENGDVVYTVSCKKRNLMRKIGELNKKHKEEYPVE